MKYKQTGQFELIRTIHKIIIEERLKGWDKAKNLKDAVNQLPNNSILMDIEVQSEGDIILSYIEEERKDGCPF